MNDRCRDARLLASQARVDPKRSYGVSNLAPQSGRSMGWQRRRLAAVRCNKRSESVISMERPLRHAGRLCHLTKSAASSSTNLPTYEAAMGLRHSLVACVPRAVVASRVDLAAARTATRGIVRGVKALVQRRQVIDDALQEHLVALDDVATTGAAPLEGVLLALRALVLYHKTEATGFRPLRRM